MRVLIIANPVSGGGKGARLADALHTALGGLVDHADLYITEKAGDARTAAEAFDGDCIAAVGGDGTTNEVLNGIRAEETALAILPAGTANVVSRELRLFHDPVMLAEQIAARKTRRIDVGLWGERRFLLGAGAGLDAVVAEMVKRQRGKRSSLLHWVGPAVRTTLAYHYPKIRVAVDGEIVSEEAQYAIVGNCRYSAGIFPATPKARIDDGLLDVCLLHNLTAVRLAALALHVWRPNFTDRPDVQYLQGTEVHFEPADPDDAAALQVDGDPAGRIPACFSLAQKALEVVAPPGRID